MKRCAKYTDEELIEICSHFKTVKDLTLNNKSAYNAVILRGIRVRAFSHMISLVSAKKWTKEECHKIALRYSYKHVFKKNHGSCYRASRLAGWLEEICSHMERIGNKFNRMIYSFEFPDNSVYVGLTGNLQSRTSAHNNNKTSPVYKHKEKTNLTPKIKILSGYVPVIQAIKEEGNAVENYRNLGWEILNRRKTGALGGCKRYSLLS